MRRISTGITGRNLLGSLFTQNNILQPVSLNSALQLSGNGTAGVEVNNNNMAINNGYFGIKTTAGGGFINLKFAGTTDYDTILPENPGAQNHVVSVKTNDGAGSIELEYKAVSVARDDDATSNVDYGLAFADTGSNEISLLKTNGTLTYNPSTATLSTTNLAETSSIVYKENVNPIGNALDVVLKLQGVTYDRKSTKKKEAGLIAEEVDKILPHVVAYKDNKPDGINYTKLTAYLIEAIKTLNLKIIDLENKGNS